MPLIEVIDRLTATSLPEMTAACNLCGLKATWQSIARVPDYEWFQQNPGWRWWRSRNTPDDVVFGCPDDAAQLEMEYHAGEW